MHKSLLAAGVVAFGAACAFAQWSAPVNISQNDDKYDVVGVYDFDASGNIHMVYKEFKDSTKRLMYAYRAAAGGSWSRTQIASGPHYGNTMVISQPDQVIHAVYDVHFGSGQRVYYTYKPVSGGSWSTPQDITGISPYINSVTGIATDDAGGIYMIFLNLYNSQAGLWGRYKPLGGSWGTPELIQAGSSDDTNWPLNSWVGCDGTNFWVAYVMKGNKYQYYKARTGGSSGTWGGAAVLDNSTKASAAVFAFDDITGEIGTVYHKAYDNCGLDFRIEARFSNDGGASFGSPVTLSTNCWLSRSPECTYDANGDFHVVYQRADCDGCGFDNWYRARIGGVWGPDTNLTGPFDSIIGGGGLPPDRGLQARGTHLYLSVDGGNGSDVYFMETKPQIYVTPGSFTKNVWVLNGLPSDTFYLSNLGPDTMPYTITDNVTWLSCTPASGDATDEQDAITVNYVGIDSMLAGTYSATITVSASSAWNTPQTIPVSLTIETVGPDFDGDADVDMDDFAHLQECLTGTGVEVTDPDCLDARLDYDGSYTGDKDVDINDVDVFLDCATGKDIPAVQGCDAL